MNSQSVDQAWPEPTVIDALRLLSGHCDGARTLDGAGFNRLDSDFGRSLAARDSLSPKQESSALKMLRKYRRQLAIGGIDYDKLADRTNQARHANSNVQDRPKRVVVLSGTRFVFRYPFDPVITAAIGKLPDRRFHRTPDDAWHGEWKIWTMPLGRCLETEELAKEHGFRIAPDAQAVIDQNRAAAQAERDRVEALIAASKAADADIDIPIEGLYPYQRGGVAWALDNPRTFIADEQGLGKTLEALATVEARELYPFMVFCTKSVSPVWRKECKQWVPHRTVQTVSTTSPIAKWVDITIVPYSVAYKRLDEIAGPVTGTREVKRKGKKVEVEVRGKGWVRSMAVDEIQYCKSDTAQRTKAVQAVADTLADDDPTILGLSGTPLVNRPSEMITELSIIRRLDDLGGFWRFWRYFCGGEKGGGKHLNQLNFEMRSKGIMIRRLKADVMPELPPRRFVDVPTLMSNPAEYRRAEDHFLAWYAEQGGNVIKARRAEVVTQMNALWKLAARLKLPAMLEWITDFLETDTKLVAFAYHQEIQDFLVQELQKHGVRAITGNGIYTSEGRTKDDAAGEARGQAVQEFQEDDSVRVFVASLMMGAEGITLTAASNVAFSQLYWVPSKLLQGVDRCHRIGQKNAVTGYRLLATREDETATIDDDMAAVLVGKQEVISQVLDGKAPAELLDQDMHSEVLDRMIARS